jgi:hypothetical protein
MQVDELKRLREFETHRKHKSTSDHINVFLCDPMCSMYLCV